MQQNRPQSLTLETEVFGPISFQGERVSSLELAPNAKTAVRLNMTAGTRPGRAQMTCRIKGLNVNGESREMEKKWFLETRSAYPPLTRIWKTQIPPNGVFELASADVHALVPETVNVRAGLGTEPVINLADHVSQLFAYPYGCLEQTVSGLFPHVFLTESDFSALGLKTHSKEETETKIRLGIQRLLEKQKSSGGFGLWDGKSPESAWLTAYAAHFFTAAHDAGFEIPRSGVKKAMDRLVQYVRRPNMIPYPGYVNRRAYRAAVRAYAAFVLARVQSLGLGDARSVFAYVDKYGSNCLGLVQAGVAQSLAGDRHTAVKAFDLAIKTQRDPETYLGDYGSNVRDFSAAYYYLSTYFPEYRYRALFLHELDAALADREWLSTQERNALVMAGALQPKGLKLKTGARLTFILIWSWQDIPIPCLLPKALGSLCHAGSWIPRASLFRCQR
ncbi:MAG: hypothetical protein HUK40_12615 [Desulfobacter sp.]|nr:hypothetical protein [Desulfobacter sp.]